MARFFGREDPYEVTYCAFDIEGHDSGDDVVAGEPMLRADLWNVGRVDSRTDLQRHQQNGIAEWIVAFTRSNRVELGDQITEMLGDMLVRHRLAGCCLRSPSRNTQAL